MVKENISIKNEVENHQYSSDFIEICQYSSKVINKSLVSRNYALKFFI